MWDDAAFHYLENFYPRVKNLRGSHKILEALTELHYRKFLTETERGYEYNRFSNSIKMSRRNAFVKFITEKRYIESFIENLDDSNVVMDVGAYHGLYSVIASHQSSKVVAFELDSKNADELRKNLELNKSDNVEVVNKPVSEESGMVEVSEEGDQTSKIASQSKSEQTRSTCIDDFAIDPDVIKIDVEGAEMAVIRGAEESIRRNEPVIFVEVHSEEVDFEELRKFLSNLGYKSDVLKSMPGQKLVLFRCHRS